MAEVGKHIKKIRKEKNLTQDQLAQRLHCTRQTISNYENGKSEPSIELLIEIAGVLEVEIGDLIYGPKKRENRKRQKIACVIHIIAPVILLLVIEGLTPLAREYAWKRFTEFPILLLRHMLRPFVLALLGWSIVQAIKELAGISIWKGKTEKSIKAARGVFCGLAVCLSVLAVVTLWESLDMAYMWYLSEQLKRTPSGFSWEDVPHLVPGMLQDVFFYLLYYVNGFAGGYLFLGAALAFFRIGRADREERESGQENERNG